MRSRPAMNFLIVAAIVLVALFVRLPGLGWGLPYVYEEAVPLKRAWVMGGWGNGGVDLNPHFFHYPSLAFYLQFGAQRVLYAAMKASGAVESTRDFRVEYHADPTPFYLLGRMVSVLFALATVAGVWLMARRLGSAAVAAAAALLLALNVFHVGRSQMVEVDVPLTAFVILALWLLVRIASRPSMRDYVLAGIAIGLATSTKYTGVLLVIPLVVAHLLWRRRPWRSLALALGAAAIVFVATSPYVLLDFATFRADLARESTHMKLGHFGGADEPAWLFHARRVGGNVLGWPAAVLAAIGLGFAFVRNRKWALVTLSFLVPYAAAISSWAVHADRYALPLLPLLAVLAAYGTWCICDRWVPARARAMVFAALMAVMLVPLATQVSRHLSRRGTDSRTSALTWIERNVRPGSLVVTESYGPPLFGPLDFWKLEDDVRQGVYERLSERARGVMTIPLFQAVPELTAPFYDIDLYRSADVIVTTSAVRGRYESDRARFPAQVAFYEALETRFELVRDVPPAGTGPRLRIYRNRGHARALAARPPGELPQFHAGRLPARWPAWFYCRLGLNLEAVGHLERALEAYGRAWPDAGESETYRQAVFGTVRVLRLLGRSSEVPAATARMMQSAPSAADRAFAAGVGGMHSP